MRIRLTTDLTQEQMDEGYDRTLLSYHATFCAWLLELQMPITHFSISWEPCEDGPHLFVSAELDLDSPVEIDSKFLDEMHLGGKKDD
tara:strand:+ start:5649 stop:5909 length:261 start_codon:yes stop_codon:yes gene_type:complete